MRWTCGCRRLSGAAVARLPRASVTHATFGERVVLGCGSSVSVRPIGTVAHTHLSIPRSQTSQRHATTGERWRRAVSFEALHFLYTLPVHAHLNYSPVPPLMSARNFISF